MTEDSDEIIIRHVPVREWATGVILAFLAAFPCLFLLYAFLVAPRNYYQTRLGEWYDLSLILIVAAVFIFLLFEIKSIRAALITVRLDQRTGGVDITRQRLYGKSAERYYFHQIEKFKSYKGRVNFSQKYFLALVLANRKTIKLKVPIGKDKNDIVKLIKKLNKIVKAGKNSEKA